MERSDYSTDNCSVARTLAIVGERWTLLILREAFLGVRRFDQIRGNLGIARNILTDRLQRLVGAGILEREAVVMDASHSGRDVTDNLLSADDENDLSRPRYERAQLTAAG